MHHPRSDRTGENAGLWREFYNGEFYSGDFHSGEFYNDDVAHFEACCVRLLRQITAIAT